MKSSRHPCPSTAAFLPLISAPPSLLGYRSNRKAPLFLFVKRSEEPVSSSSGPLLITPARIKYKQEGVQAYQVFSPSAPPTPIEMQPVFNFIFFFYGLV